MSDTSGRHLRVPEITSENLRLMRRWGQQNERLKAVKQAYLAMWAKARYRPEAPSDGFGQIMLDDDQLADPLRLEMEAWLAGRRFYEADERMSFEVIGCSDYSNVATMYLALEAAQLCCGGANPRIRRILELALAALPDDSRG